MSAFDLPLVQAGMHGLYTGHITHGTRFGMKYYAKNVVPDFCVSCASVAMLAGHTGMVWSRYSFTILAAKIYYVVLF